MLSVAIGRALRLPADDLEVLRLGALLHDIGKIGVPDDVLRKPGALTPAEFDIIKQHPGARRAHPAVGAVPRRRHIPIVELHHERPDGRGYPHGLRGDDIPLAARIVHVADAYDAMTSARAYRGARPPATRCASCGAAPAPSFTPRSSARSPPRCPASPPTRARSCSRACMRSARGVCWAAAACLRSWRSPFPPPLRRPRARSASTARSAIDRVRRRERLEPAADRRRHHRHRAAWPTGWQVYVRPWFRLPRPSPPTARRRRGTRSSTRPACATSAADRSPTRVDAGYIVSPVGLGMFDANPSVNPTIAAHSSYFTPMLPFDAGGPRGPAIASTYPLGAVLTLSAARLGRARGRRELRAGARTSSSARATNPAPRRSSRPAPASRRRPAFASACRSRTAHYLKDERADANGVRAAIGLSRSSGSKANTRSATRRSPASSCAIGFTIPGRVRRGLRVVRPGHADADAALVRSAAGRKARRRRSPVPASCSARSRACSPAS